MPKFVPKTKVQLKALVKDEKSVFVANSSLEAVFKRENEVGKLAYELFTNAKRIEWENSSFDEKIAQTKMLIERGVCYIYEATFSFGGSYSIKKIQPILAPSINDGYKAMASSGEISNGGEAMNAFLAFATMSSEQIAKKHKELLSYCGLIQYPKV